MSDKLNRLADQLEQVRVYQYEDGCNDPEDAKGRDEAVRLLRTLAPVLAKCEVAMGEVLMMYEAMDGEAGGARMSDDDANALRTALAELREVGR